VKPMQRKLPLKQLAAAALLGAITVSFAHGGGANWVIKRDDKIDSPIFKQRPMIAHQEMAPAVEQGYIAERYAAALHDYQSRIRRQWPNAEVSNATRWVSYSNDYAVRKVVDFKSNLIEISLENLYNNGQPDVAAVRAGAQAAVVELLASRLSDAEQHDPVALALNDVFEERGAMQGGDTEDPLVFPELFAGTDPDASEVAAVAERLMQGSRIRFQALSASVGNLPVIDRRQVTYVVPLPANRAHLKARQYHPVVKRHADRAGLPVAGVLAMMHAESQFNPLARSHAPAFGLMQVVPSTMGKQAALVLFHDARLLSPRYLADADRNIEVATAYLGELYNGQAAGITNPQSRWYFVQAAYKIGLAEAARNFDAGADSDKAVMAINKLQPTQVLQRLTRQDAKVPLRDYFTQVQQLQAAYKTL
jgi:membrane-bound lytic murein transglycosylase C